MRLEPLEGAMDSRMDQRDQMKRLLLICGLAGSVSLFLMSSRTFMKAGILLGAAAILAACFCGGFLYRVHRLIMPMKGCYLELQGQYFAVRQVFRDGQYELCRIYYDEVREIVKDKVGFYVRAELAKGIIRRPGREDCTCFEVRSFGYQEEEFQAFYSALLDKLAGRKEAKIYGEQNTDERTG